MQKKISAHQKDTMSIDIQRQELAMKREAIELMKESVKSSDKAIESMTSSIKSIGESMKESMGMLAQSMIQCQQMSMMSTNVFSNPNILASQSNNNLFNSTFDNNKST